MTTTGNYETYIRMPNHHLTDNRLSYKARGLFSVILNLPDDWHLTKNGLVALSDKDGKDAVNSALQELIDLGYISIERNRDKRGMLAGYQYHINPNPRGQEGRNESGECFIDEECCENYCGKNVETVESNESTTENPPQTGNPSAENPAAVYPSAENPTQYNNIQDIDIYRYTDGLIDARARVNDVEKNALVLKTEWQNRIRENIDYSVLRENFSSQQDELDELVELMVDVLLSDSDSRAAVGGKMLPTCLLKNRFLSLRYQHIEQVLLNLANNKCRVKNIHAYLMTCLYNSYTTASNQVAQQVNFHSKSEPVHTEPLSAMEWAMAQLA